MADVQIHGLRELELRLKALGKEADKLLAKSLRKGANVIKNQAIINAPFDPEPNEKRDKKTGIRGEKAHIKESIKVRRDPNPKLSGKSEIMYIKPFYTKKKSVSYWWFLELGSINTPATRFLTRAYEAKKMEAVEVLKEDLGKQIEGVARRLNK